MTTRAVARDEMCVAAAAALINVGKILWDDRVEDIPSTDTSWARVTIKHMDQEQAALGVISGKRRYRSTGTLYVQLFTPIGNGLSLSDELAIQAMNYLRGLTTPSDVKLMNVSAEEVGPDGAFFQVNLVAKFEYDELE